MDGSDSSLSVLGPSSLSMAADGRPNWKEGAEKCRAWPICEGSRCGAIVEEASLKTEDVTGDELILDALLLQSISERA